LWVHPESCLYRARKGSGVTLRVLMLSKACVVGTYQRKLEELAAVAPDLDLVVAVPPSWKDAYGCTELQRAYTQGYRLEVTPIALNGLYHLHFYPKFGDLLANVHPDIVHIDEEPYNFATYHANRIARRAGARTLWFSWQNLRRRYPPPFSWMERYNLTHVDYGIVGSESAAGVWRAKGFTKPLAVIPQFGVDPSLFHPPAKPRPGSPVHIAYIGRLVPEKGVDLLLDALHTLHGVWRATLIGGGPAAADLKAQAERLNVQGAVTFRDAVPSTAMPDIYRDIDILVLPSRTKANWIEQFGRVLIEAMASGVAVIGSETGEIPYVIGEAGRIFPEEDVEALRSALESLIADPELRLTLGKKGRARVLERYTQGHIAQATLDVYRSLSL
jgi:glycosyltransferase involved in cell wall biosynthesis